MIIFRKNKFLKYYSKVYKQNIYSGFAPSSSCVILGLSKFNKSSFISGCLMFMWDRSKGSTWQFLYLAILFILFGFLRQTHKHTYTKQTY